VVISFYLLYVYRYFFHRKLLVILCVGDVKYFIVIVPIYRSYSTTIIFLLHYKVHTCVLDCVVFCPTKLRARYYSCSWLGQRTITTRGNSLLDLVMTSEPELIDEVMDFGCFSNSDH